MRDQAAVWTQPESEPVESSVSLDVRPSRLVDMPMIAAIYGHHVLHGTASFEEVPPGQTEMVRRWQAITAQGLPHLVAVADGMVAGFAYAGPYRTRSAYRYTVEDTVYVAHDRAGRGIGRALLQRLIVDCRQMGYRQMVGVIGDSANAASIGLHAALGFRQAGVLEHVGFKFGRWIDSVIMQRPLAGGDDG